MILKSRLNWLTLYETKRVCTRNPAYIWTCEPGPPTPSSYWKCRFIARIDSAIESQATLRLGHQLALRFPSQHTIWHAILKSTPTGMLAAQSNQSTSTVARISEVPSYVLLVNH
ncbi:hypothetical protein TNCV_92101 [Trichonephila clavipes]|nr:hypothetical protein TNCV_92101 [Trichonephila clavipes]